MRLPNLSIAAKLYAIFALLASVSVVLAAVAVTGAHRHAALTTDFGAEFTPELREQEERMRKQLDSKK